MTTSAKALFFVLMGEYHICVSTGLMPDGISSLPGGVSPQKTISRGGELQLKADFAVVRHIVKVGSSLLVPQRHSYWLYTFFNSMAARLLVDVEVTEDAAADHRRRIEEDLLPLDHSTNCMISFWMTKVGLLLPASGVVPTRMIATHTLMYLSLELPACVPPHVKFVNRRQK